MMMPETSPEAKVRDLDVQGGEILLVDKPAGWTSFDVVNKLRHLFHVRKIGHAGTLDPAATGLLIICTAGKTKGINAFVGLQKEYDAEMVLGARTESFDGESPVIEEKGTEGITPEAVRSVLQEFTGPQRQLAPMWSAVKVRGRRLYEYARRGEHVEREPREIVIESIIPTEIAVPRVCFTVVCSKGTYIRSLVNDIGIRLGCGAYLSRLRRTRIGPYRLADAYTLDDLIAYAHRMTGGGT